MQELKIEIIESQITLFLVKNGDKVDSEKWKDENSLSESLLVKIDNLLQKNLLKPAEIKHISVSSDQPDGYTTTRIAQAVADTFNFAKN